METSVHGSWIGKGSLLSINIGMSVLFKMIFRGNPISSTIPADSFVEADMLTRKLFQKFFKFFNFFFFFLKERAQAEEGQRDTESETGSRL